MLHVILKKYILKNYFKHNYIIEKKIYHNVYLKVSLNKIVAT